MIVLKRNCLWNRVVCLALCFITVLLTASPAAALSAPADDVSEEPTQSAYIHPVSKVRAAPQPNTVIIGCLENGTPVTIMGDYGSYYQIDCHEMLGYIRKEQISVDDSGSYVVACNPSSTETTYMNAHTPAQALELAGQIRNLAIMHYGIPYVRGGTSPRGFDCSGLTQYVFGKVDYTLKRTVAQQLQSGVIIPKEDLQCGDLVFFKYTTAAGSLYSHVGIYIGNGQIIHASSTRGVTVDNLGTPYYTEHYLCARRVILSDLTHISTTATVGATQTINSAYWRENSQTA